MNKDKRNFLYNIIDKDIKNKDIIITRFPPEPNGYLHIGHAKSIYINFQIAKKYKGKCYLRFDDTNPETEKKKFLKSIKKDIKWLGYKWNDKIKYSSDYFKIYYKYAIKLIQKNLAYIDELSKKKIKKYRGTLKKLGKNSPYRNRSIKENLKLFKEMRKGKFKEKKICLRAKINMKSKNLSLRDPILYRIKYSKHYRTKKKWCIYPTYDFAHCIADYIENITHSICTLEFQNNKYLYEWILNNLNFKKQPKQYEFAKLNLTHTITSKRKIKFLIKNNFVKSWNDPRLMTLSGMRNRGYTPKSIKNFCQYLGISKQESIIDISILEEFLRKELNITSPRAIAIINPLKIDIINFEKNKLIKFKIPNHPQNSKMGKRNFFLSSKIYIDSNDFKENNVTNFKGLTLNNLVKLRYAGILKVKKIIKTNNKIKYLKCYYIDNKNFDHTKLGIIHWISKENSIKAKFRLFNYLFNELNPNKIEKEFYKINPNSLIIKKGYVEKSMEKVSSKKIFQFEREGYFKKNKKKKKFKLIFDRIIQLKKRYLN